MTKRMLLGGKRSLEDVLPKSIYERLSKYVKAKGLPMRMFGRQKVWAVNMQIVLLDVMKKARGTKPL